MAKADGSIVIETDVDNKKAQKKLDAVEKKIETIQSRISNSKSKESAIKEQLDAAKQAAKETETEIAKLNAEMASLKDVTSGKIQAAPQEWVNANMRQKEITEELAAQQRILDNQDKATERIDREYTKAVDKTREYTDQLEKAKADAGDLKKQIGEIKNNTDKLAPSAEKIEKSFSKLGKRIMALAASAFVFTAIYTALRLLKSYLWDAIMANSQARASIAQLKGALMTLAQPILEIVIPAFTLLAQALTAVVTQIAKLVSFITGKSLKASAASAKALNSQTKALGGTAKAADKASKSMANFDEINQLSSNQTGSDSGGGTSAGGGDSTDIAPDFSFLDNVDERLGRIAATVALIGAGFALWTLASDLPGMLGTVLTKLGLIAAAVGGVILMFDGLKDAWENGIDWGNMAEMIGGATVAAVALGLAFGSIAAGIALVVAGSSLIITAFNDICNNGTNLKNVLTLLAGIVMTGLGFLFLTGSVIPLVIAGIAALIAMVLALTGNLGEFAKNLKENILGGIIDFIKGVFTGDLNLALKGLHKVAVGAVNALLITVESAINLMIDAINWLITQLNTIHFEVPSWVPGIGGRSWGIHFDPIAHATLPRLAQGAVIPPNREFMAVLGDQKQGTNIETPLDTMVQAFRQALSEGGYNDKSEAYLVLDRDVLGKVVYKLNKAEGNRIGVNLAGV